MEVNIAKPLRVQPMHLEKMSCDKVAGPLGHRQPVELEQALAAVGDAADRDLTDDQRMNEEHVGREQPKQQRFGRMETIDPNRRIDEDHSGSGRVRGGTHAAGSLPPTAES